MERTPTPGLPARLRRWVVLVAAGVHRTLGAMQAVGRRQAAALLPEVHWRAAALRRVERQLQLAALRQVAVLRGVDRRRVEARRAARQRVGQRVSAREPAAPRW